MLGGWEDALLSSTERRTGKLAHCLCWHQCRMSEQRTGPKEREAVRPIEQPGESILEWCRNIRRSGYWGGPFGLAICKVRQWFCACGSSRGDGGTFNSTFIV
ncbi:unnamed protein product [Ostreobium quekettii]|uniref:Uncharacterized protein n=1 Tax=Ostreobium quekettii TaxID=121088 RepID=A0A8S1IUQ1_9CHLO|nr:unnamed protein product [Ostreobium quekettii]